MADGSRARKHKTILQTRFFYVASIFAVSLGTVSLLWEYGRSLDWVLIMFGITWVGVLTAFAWEMVTRNERLDAMVHQRTEELESRNLELARMNRRLRELDEFKSSLISSVSHELRTPLTSIRSFSEILLDYEDIEPEARAEFTRIIKEECERLTRLIEDLLDLAKISSGKAAWRTEPVDVEVLARRSRSLLHAHLKKAGLPCEIRAEPGLPQGLACADRIVQVLDNLLSNAVKFTPRGGRVDIDIRSVRRPAESDGGRPFIQVCVADTGVGIDPADHERIFERFVQVGDTLTAKPHGTGLGLAIAREIVERTGGEIWVDSRLGEGSRFYFTVPVYDPQTPSTEPSRPDA